MSQLPKITIADLLSQTRVGMLEARISEVSVFPVVSKYANPPGATVNVYKLKLIDKTGSIEYSDWCKKPGLTRAYKVNQIVRFHHAKLKLSQNIDPNTQQLYPPTVTVEKSTIIELLNSNGDAIIPKTNPVSAVIPTIPVASSPVATAIPMAPVQPIATTVPPMAVPTAQPVASHYILVKANYPEFYNAVDVLFEKIYEQLNAVQQANIDLTYKDQMDLIWGVGS